MPKLKLPPRLETGTMQNFKRSYNVQVRLRELGALYRKKYRRAERSYRRWLEFLHEHEPTVLCRDVESTLAHYEAAPKG